MRRYTADEIRLIMQSRVPPFVGDTGAGGLPGSVPTPPAGSGSLGMVLNANGTWTVQSGGVSGGSGFSVNVKQYGALGNGINDDTDGIQLAINTVNAAGGGVVYFPKGVYRVRVAQTTEPTWKHCLTIYPKIVFRGESRESSIIKLIDNAGNYMGMIARPADDFGGMNDVGFYDLSFDQNNTYNAPSTLSDLTSSGAARFVILCYGGRRIAVKNCSFIDTKNINTMTFNAPAGMCGDVEVVGNRFYMADSGSIDNDHSSIYTSADNVIIDNNLFISSSMGNYGARTAIETHGDMHIVTNNIIKNYLNGMNITGVALTSDNIIVSNNTIQNARAGITLWSWFFAENVDQPALTNCIISNNDIILDRDGWLGYPGVNYVYGIGPESTGTAPIVNLSIKDNFIYFKPSTNGIEQDNLSSGVLFLRSAISGQGFDQNIIIEGNTIQNSPGNGIDLRTSCKVLKCDNNTIINPGQSNYPIFSSFRSGVLAFPVGTEVQEDWNITNNIFIDNQETATMAQAVALGDSVAINCNIKGNVWRVANKILGTNRILVGTAAASAGWYNEWTTGNLSINDDVVGYVKPGSKITSVDTGIVYTQVDAPQGANYVADQASFYAAYTIPFGNPLSTGSLSASNEFTYIESNVSSLLLGQNKSSELILRKGEDKYAALSFWKNNTLNIQLLYDENDENLALNTYNISGSYNNTVFTIPVTGNTMQFNRDINLPANTITSQDVIVQNIGGGDRVIVAEANNALGGSDDLRYLFGNLVVGGTSPGVLFFNGPASTAKGILWASSASQRINLQTNGSESGDDAGGNLAMNMYSDTAQFIDTAAVFNRKAGTTIDFNRPLALNGGISPRIAGFTANTTAYIKDTVLSYSGTVDANVIAPASNILGIGRAWVQVVKNSGTGTVTYTPSGSDLLNGSSAPVKILPGQLLTVYSNGGGSLLFDDTFNNRDVYSVVKNISISTTGDVAIFTRLPGTHVLQNVTVWTNTGVTTAGTISISTLPNNGNSVYTTSLTALSGSNSIISVTPPNSNYLSAPVMYLNVTTPSSGTVNVILKAMNLDI